MKQKPNKIDLIRVLFGIFAVILTVMAVVLFFGGKRESTEFTPPPFDPAAVADVPEVPEALGYISPWKEGMGYRFSVCGNVVMEGSTAIVYLTNPPENQVWIKLRVLDENGSTLGETGLIQPGEYVKDVLLAGNLPVGTTVRLKIMGYEPETYYSAGAVVINTVIGDMPQ